MLEKFAVANFRGFKKRIEFDLSKPRNYDNCQYAIKNAIVKDAMIYGPNGSGKSNIGFAMFDIIEHLTTNSKNVGQYVNFTYANNNLPVIFEYYFNFGGQKVEYIYSKYPNGTLYEESFVVGRTEYFHKRDSQIYINKDYFNLSESFIEEIRNNANNVSLVTSLISTYPLPKDHILLQFSEFVKRMLWFRCLEDRGYAGFESGSTKLDEYIINNGLVSDFASFIERISGQHFDFLPADENDKKLRCMIDGNILLFQNVASTGTDSLELLYYWYTKLNKVSLVFIDEFDAFYHFELASEICKVLFKLDCQVILTTHNTSLMTNDLLRPDCYYLIDGTQMKPIADCTQKELRLGHNLEKIYRGEGFRL